MIKPALTKVVSEVGKALTEAKLAYEFMPNAYTYSCLSACLAAEVALAALSDMFQLQEENEET
jgi:hypothetical protein